MKSIEQPLHSQMVELVEIEFRGEVNARANALRDALNKSTGDNSARF